MISRTHNLMIAIAYFVVAWLFLSLLSCGPSVEDAYVEEEILIKLKNVTVHVCPKDHHALPYPKLGLACKENHIWIFGKIEDGEIVLDHRILGHELTHLLHYENDRIVNPDK